MEEKDSICDKNFVIVFCCLRGRWGRDGGFGTRKVVNYIYKKNLDKLKNQYDSLI